MRKQTLLSVLALAASLVMGHAQATTMTYSAASGTRAAMVSFEISGTNLFVTLTNTSAADAWAPSDVLTAVFFNLAGNPSLAPISATVPNGSSVVCSGSGCPSASTLSKTNVSGEWAYKSNINTWGAYYGISSSGLGNLFGPYDRFSTAKNANLQGPASPDGIQYGITTAGDNPATGNGGLSGNALIKNQTQFKLALPANYDSSRFGPGLISNVAFQYGTSLSEPHMTVPEPGPFALLSIGLVALAAARKFRHRKPA